MSGRISISANGVTDRKVIRLKEEAAMWQRISDETRGTHGDVMK